MSTHELALSSLTNAASGGAGGEQTGVVDEDVEYSESLDNRGDSAIDSGFVFDVKHKHSIEAELSGSIGIPGVIAPREKTMTPN